MTKTFVGPKLRELRREKGQTQAEMAKALGVSAAYVNLLENNQRSLSLQVLMALSDAYAVDWRDLIKDETSNTLADLRNTLQDPAFDDNRPDLQELRAAIDHAPPQKPSFTTFFGTTPTISMSWKKPPRNFVQTFHLTKMTSTQHLKTI